MIKLNKLFLYLVAILAFTISSCEDDEGSNPVGTGSNTINFTVSGDLDLGAMSVTSNFTDTDVDSITLRSFGGRDEDISIAVVLNNGDVGSYDLSDTDHSITFVSQQESYVHSSGTLNITTYTDSKLVGTFDDVILTSMTGGNELTLSNGSYNITERSIPIAHN